MQYDLRDRVRHEIQLARAENPYVDVDALSRSIAEEFGFDPESTFVMLKRLVMHECARLGIGMRAMRRASRLIIARLERARRPDRSGCKAHQGRS